MESVAAAGREKPQRRKGAKVTITGGEGILLLGGALIAAAAGVGAALFLRKSRANRRPPPPPAQQTLKFDENKINGEGLQSIIPLIHKEEDFIVESICKLHQSPISDIICIPVEDLGEEEYEDIEENTSIGSEKGEADMLVDGLEESDETSEVIEQDETRSSVEETGMVDEVQDEPEEEEEENFDLDVSKTMLTSKEEASVDSMEEEGSDIIEESEAAQDEQEEVEVDNFDLDVCKTMLRSKEEAYVDSMEEEGSICEIHQSPISEIIEESELILEGSQVAHLEDLEEEEEDDDEKPKEENTSTSSEEEEAKLSIEEEGSDETGSSSMESIAEAVWPSEAIEQVEKISLIEQSETIEHLKIVEKAMGMVDAFIDEKEREQELVDQDVGGKEESTIESKLMMEMDKETEFITKARFGVFVLLVAFGLAFGLLLFGQWELLFSKY